MKLGSRQETIGGIIKQSCIRTRDDIIKENPQYKSIYLRIIIKLPHIHKIIKNIEKKIRYCYYIFK